MENMKGDFTMKISDGVKLAFCAVNVVYGLALVYIGKKKLFNTVVDSVNWDKLAERQINKLKTKFQ